MVLLGGLELVVGGVIVNEYLKNEKAKKEREAEKRRPRRHSDDYARPMKRRDSWDRLKSKNKLPQKPVGQPISQPKPQKPSKYAPQDGPSGGNGYLTPPSAPTMGRVGSAPPPGYYPANNLNAQYQPISRPSNNNAQYGGYRYEEGGPKPPNPYPYPTQTPQYPPPPQPFAAVPNSAARPAQPNPYYPPPPNSQTYPQPSPVSPLSVASGSTTSTFFEPPAGFAELSSTQERPWQRPPPAGYVELPVGESSSSHPSRYHGQQGHQGRPVRVHFEDGLDSEKRPVTPPPPYREY